MKRSFDGTCAGNLIGKLSRGNLKNKLVQEKLAFETCTEKLHENLVQDTCATIKNFVPELISLFCLIAIIK